MPQPYVECFKHRELGPIKYDPYIGCPECDRIKREERRKKRDHTGQICVESIESIGVSETQDGRTVKLRSSKIVSVSDLKMEICPRCHRESMSRIKVKWECFNPHCRLRTHDPAQAGLADRFIAFFARLFR